MSHSYLLILFWTFYFTGAPAQAACIMVVADTATGIIASDKNILAGVAGLGSFKNKFGNFIHTDHGQFNSKSYPQIYSFLPGNNPEKAIS
jgi:hypothetical protein